MFFQIIFNLFSQKAAVNNSVILLWDAENFIATYGSKGTCQPENGLCNASVMVLPGLTLAPWRQQFKNVLQSQLCCFHRSTP
eukprot:3670637-Rhodomonas_salina.1